MAKLFACVTCGSVVDGYNPQVFTLNMDELNGGPRVEMAWCGGVEGRTCAETDPLHLEMAVAQGMPDGQAGDDAVCTTFLRILDRIGAERGPEGLRAAVKIRRDVFDPKVTMRGPGLAWGRRCER